MFTGATPRSCTIGAQEPHRGFGKIVARFLIRQKFDVGDELLVGEMETTKHQKAKTAKRLRAWLGATK